MLSIFKGHKIREIWHDLHTLLLLNFITQRSEEGLTYYDLQQYDNVPHSRIYRAMKKLEEEGYLSKSTESNETGRPKHLFKISPKGKQYRDELQIKLRNVLNVIKSKFPEHMDFDIDSFLEDGTIKLFKTPIQHVLESDMQPKEKLKCLKAMKQDHQEILQDIRKNIQKLEKMIGDSEA
jgi:DNA-binding PadR family transcriptional regulator